MKFYELVIKVLGKNKNAIELITGAKLFKDEKNNLIISNIKASQKIKNIHINYNEETDLINILFFNRKGKLIKAEREVYIDMVKKIVEEETNTYFSL